MRTRGEVTHDKLRGGFYTPDQLVDLCFSRTAQLISGRSSLRLVEPSSGDGAFVRGLGRSPLRERVGSLTAIEPFEAEAAKCRAALADSGVRGSVIAGSAVEWAATTQAVFDVAVGNPPFVRFQFVSEQDRRGAVLLAQRLGISFAGVSNLWLPVLLGSLARLEIGGAFAFVVPAECFTGVSAGVVRHWLVEHSSDLRVDLFPPGSFPEVLQEVVVLSGRRAEAGSGPLDCTIGSERHVIPAGTAPWTRYLLGKDQRDAVEEATALPVVAPLGALARFEVAAVTGANHFFSVDTATVDAFDLGPWSRALLPRVRHAPGLRYTAADHERADAEGARVHLLDFADGRPDPEQHGKPAAYLRAGTGAQLHLRYKTRIRTPWYRVPWIRAGELMLSKRSHHHPRMILNDVGAVTTDTIYRGRAHGPAEGRAPDLAAGFHNSLTLLSAELEGRSFGGGVLELVPSETARLAMPFIPGLASELDRLDGIARADREGLVEETDRLLVKAGVGLDPSLLARLGSARRSLLQRRLERSAGQPS